MSQPLRRHLKVKGRQTACGKPTSTKNFIRTPDALTTRRDIVSCAVCLAYMEKQDKGYKRVSRP